MRNLFRKLISVLLIVACVFINTSAFAESNLTIHFLDVGQGAAAIIQCDGEVMMFDGGSAGNSSFIYSYLQNTLDLEHIDVMVKQKRYRVLFTRHPDHRVAIIDKEVLMDECYIVAVQDFGETYEYRYPTLEAALRFMTIEMLPCSLWALDANTGQKRKMEVNNEQKDGRKAENRAGIDCISQYLKDTDFYEVFWSEKQAISYWG